MDLFEWRWAKKIRELSPWWQFTHNTEGHYTISPAEYVDPEERWEQCEVTLRQPTYHTMYNLPNDSESITYWDVFTQFTRNCTAEQMKRELDEFAVQEDVWRFITDRGCPKDMEDFVWRWAEEEKELKLKWQKWAQRGIEDHIITVTEEITGITMEDCMKKDIPPPLRRSATGGGSSMKVRMHVLPESALIKRAMTLIMVEVRAPKACSSGVNSRWLVQKKILCGSKKSYQQECDGCWILSGPISTLRKGHRSNMNWSIGDTPAAYQLVLINGCIYNCCTTSGTVSLRKARKGCKMRIGCCVPEL